jgi:hypothetical protein
VPTKGLKQMVDWHESNKDILSLMEILLPDCAM